MRFDLTDLRVYLQACDCGSMTEAAARCSLTLAAVSARIRALEQEAGTPLLRRHARGVAPTPAGEALARHARLVLHQAESLRREMALLSLGQDRPIVLLANSSALLRPLHLAIAGLAERHPGARVVLRESGSEATVHALHTGAADLGLVSDAAVVEGLQAQVLGADPLAVVVPASHALAGRERVRFDEILGEDWIGWGEGSALQLHLAMQASRAGGVLAAKLVAPTGAAVLELVSRGLGISVVPKALLIDQAHRRSGIAVVPLDETWARRRLLLCRRIGDDKPLVGLLADALAAIAGEPRVR